MYDLKKRAYFSTLGELRALLAGMPDNTIVCTAGSVGSWLHVECSGRMISFDDDSLTWDYREYLSDAGVENAGDVEDAYYFQQQKDHMERIK